MTNDSRRFGFTYGYDDAVTAAMKERTYQWMDIVFVDFGEISGDCLLRKSRPAIVLSGTEYNESSPILTVAPMTRSLKGLDSKGFEWIIPGCSHTSWKISWWKAI